MFDSTGRFTKQFTPVEGGYLFYPSKKDGGKIVTVAEYEQLTDGWRKVAGRRGMCMSVGVVVLTILIWSTISAFVSLPDWSDNIFVAALGMGIPANLLWASFAPRRLVRDRLSIPPPRPTSEVKRHVRALLNWRLVIFSLLFTGIIFIGSLNSTERDIESWAWLIGSGTLFVVYVWIAIQKFRDR